MTIVTSVRTFKRKIKEIREYEHNFGGARYINVPLNIRT